jgi:4-carboxymuconolactone decarboxylase
MTDFPILKRDDLDEKQRALWDRITLGPRGFYCGGPKSKRVPDLYNAYLQFPELGQGIFDIAEAIRSNTELPGRQRELIVLTTSIQLGMRVEYDFHVPFARDQGISDDVIVAIGERRAPQFDRQDDRAVYDANRQLLTSATLTDDLRSQLVGLYGYPGLMQLLATVMLYVITAYTTNVAKVEILEDFSADQDQLNDYYAGRS